MSTQAAGGGSAYKFNHTGAVSPMHTTLSIFSALTLIASGCMLSDWLTHLHSAYDVKAVLYDENRLFEAANLVATAVFGFGGAVVAGQYLLTRQTNFGRISIFLLCLIAGTSTAIFGGGLIRDLMLSNRAPFFIYAYNEAGLAMISALVGTLMSKHIRGLLEDILRIADHVSLGIFVALGTEKAITFAGGLDAAPVITVAFLFAGATGAGGGLIRDIFILRRLPIAFATSYGITAASGGLLHIYLLRLIKDSGFEVYANSAWIMTTFVVTIVAEATRHWRLAPSIQTA